MLRESDNSSKSSVSIHTVNAPVERRWKASEIRKLPAAERSQILREEAKKAAKMYAEHPELIIDGGAELIDY